MSPNTHTLSFLWHLQQQSEHQGGANSADSAKPRDCVPRQHKVQKTQTWEKQKSPFPCSLPFPTSLRRPTPHPSHL